MFIRDGFPHLPNEMLSEYHKFVLFVFCLNFVVRLGAVLGVVATLASFALASFSNPGVITKDNLEDFKTHPYDNIIYHKKECTSCNFQKYAHRCFTSL